MGIYASVNGRAKKITKITTRVVNTLKNVSRVYMFVNGERKLLFPEPGTLVFEQSTSGYYTIELQPGTYVAEVAGSGGRPSNGMQPTYARHGGNGELVREQFVLTSKQTVSIWVAGGSVPASLNYTGAYGAVNGIDGAKAYSGSVLMATGGGGGGRSRVLCGTIDITADGGGGIFGYSGASLNAPGGNGSGGALGGMDRNNMNGQDAGNGLGGAGSQIDASGLKTPAQDGWVKIYLEG